MEDELKRLLRDHPGRRLRARWGCADESKLAAYADGRLDPNARAALENHLADCDACLSQVAFLVRSSAVTDSVEVPAQLIGRAKSLVQSTRRQPFAPGWRWAMAVAAVVTVAFLIGLALQLRTAKSEKSGEVTTGARQSEQSPEPVGQPSRPARNPDVVAVSSPPSRKVSKPTTAPSVPLIRNAEPENHTPNVTFPREGASVKRAAAEVRWRGSSDVVFYEVSIITASGDTVIASQTQETRFSIPAEPQLTVGAKYFVSIRAHFRDGKTTRSGIVSFTLID